MPPRAVAQALAEHLCLDGSFFDRCEVAGPGFMNFYLSDSYYAAVVRDIVALGDGYGRSDFAKGSASC